METLIELYDDRPLENVLGVETFHPRRVVYVCPDSAFQDRRLGEKLKTYFKHREMDVWSVPAFMMRSQSFRC